MNLKKLKYFRVVAQELNFKRAAEKFYTLTTVDRHGILAYPYIRRLHPIECERLQTLEDGYSEGISDNQRYKCCGNGWTVDVIAHLLRYLKN